LREAKWPEFDLDREEWRIPKGRMKMKDAHVVPLPRQALEILHELHSLTGSGTFLFPNVRQKNRPMSENTLNSALCALGFDGDEQTVHGFRTLASTRMNEMDVNPDLIELQLAHLERKPSRQAYNKAMKLPARKRLMQWWADVLDELRNGTDFQRTDAINAEPHGLAQLPGAPSPEQVGGSGTMRASSRRHGAAMAQDETPDGLSLVASSTE
jgi:hypothetical protein